MRAAFTTTSSTMQRPSMMQSAVSRRTLRITASVTADKASLDISKMTPLSDRLLVKPLVEEKKSAGGILLPKGPPKANSDAHFGEVVAVGDEVDLEVKAGDMVVFQKYAMAEVEVPEGEVLFVAQKSIMGVLQK